MHRRNWRNSKALYPPLFLPGIDLFIAVSISKCGLFLCNGGKIYEFVCYWKTGEGTFDKLSLTYLFYVRQTEEIYSWWNSQHIPAPCTVYERPNLFGKQMSILCSFGFLHFKTQTSPQYRKQKDKNLIWMLSSLILTVDLLICEKLRIWSCDKNSFRPRKESLGD